MKRCEHCEIELYSFRSSRARFCSTRCRVASHRAQRPLPAELTSKSNWIRHDERKRPLTTAGRAASTATSNTWTTYANAAASTVGTGMGFVLDGTGIGCIDLDDAFQTDGQLYPWAAQILADNRGTFVETSLSGNGIHIWGYMAPTRGRRIRDGRNIEVYSMGRYIALGKRHSTSGNSLQPLNLASV